MDRRSKKRGREASAGGRNTAAEAAKTGIDMYMGLGGAPEGVLAAAALKCMGGQMWGRLTFRNDDEKARAAKAGITDLDRIYARDDMVSQDVIFDKAFMFTVAYSHSLTLGGLHFHPPPHTPFPEIN